MQAREGQASAETGPWCGKQERVRLLGPVKEPSWLGPAGVTWRGRRAQTLAGLVSRYATDREDEGQFPTGTLPEKLTSCRIKMGLAIRTAGRKYNQ